MYEFQEQELLYIVILILIFRRSKQKLFEIVSQIRGYPKSQYLAAVGAKFIPTLKLTEGLHSMTLLVQLESDAVTEPGGIFRRNLLSRLPSTPSTILASFVKIGRHRFSDSQKSTKVERGKPSIFCDFGPKLGVLSYR